MNRPNITNATIFPKLRIILNDDIRVINNMMSRKEKGSDIHKLLDSLKFAKEQILGKFPANEEGVGSISTTPNRLNIVGYENSNEQDETSLVSALYHIESEQMDFVKNGVVDEGIPNDLLKILKEILEIYETVTDQLGRTSKTNQINAIVL